MTAQRVEQRRRFKAVLCAKPRTFHEIRDERKRSEKTGQAIVPPVLYKMEDDEEDGRVLDGFFLVRKEMSCRLYDLCFTCEFHSQNMLRYNVKKKN